MVQSLDKNRWRTTLLASLLASLVVALGDSLITWLTTSSSSLSLGDRLAYMGHALGLCGLAGLILGLGAWLLLCPAARALGWPEPLRSRLRSDPDLDHRVAAAVLACPLAMALPAVVAGAIYLASLTEAHNTTLAALYLMVWVAGAAGLGLLVWAALAFALRRLGRALRPSRGGRSATEVTIYLLLALALLAGALGLSRLDWKVLSPGAVGLAGLYPALGVIIFLTLSRRGAASLLRLGLPLLALVVLAGGSLSALTLGDNPNVALLLSRDSPLASRLARAYRGLWDLDRDGYSPLFGGGDCDDSSAAISPGADDIPGNGIDEDCLDGDAPVVVVEPVVEPVIEEVTADGGGPLVAVAPAVPAVEEPPAPQARNVMVIILDTFRADHMGYMGYKRPTTPRLDDLAKRSTIFTQAYAQAPNTPRSFPSFFTSRYPHQIHWHRKFSNFSPITPENLTFFEVLQQGGVHTRAATSHWYFEKKRGIDQGVDLWDNSGAAGFKESNTETSSPRILKKARGHLDELAKRNKPFCFLVHFNDAHSRYMVHPSVTSFGKTLMDKYDNEILFVDGHVGQLLDHLESTGLADKTAVIIFGDHGEAFREHGIYFHGQNVYNELLHVPLLVHLPGAEARRVEARVPLLDLGPTVIDLMAQRVPPEMEGRSLLPLVTGQAAGEDRSFGVENLPYPNWKHHHAAWYDGPYKIIHDVTDNTYELYDIKADPREQRNLISKEREVAKRMRGALREWMRR